jgi:hypothetical protein
MQVMGFSGAFVSLHLYSDMSQYDNSTNNYNLNYTA